MSTASPRPARSRTRNPLGITLVFLAALVIAFFIFSSLYTDALWFGQLGYLEVLTTQWASAVAMFLVGFFGMALPVLIAVEAAFRARPVYAKLSSQLDRYQQVIEPLRRLAMWGIPAVLGVFMGVSTSMRWPTVAQYLNRTPFGVKDAQFGLDNSFYIYELPFYRGVLGYASAVLVVAFIATIATAYLYGGIRASGRELRVTRPARLQIAVTAALFLAVQAVSIWLDQYATVTDANGVSNRVTGATYSDVFAIIPGRAVLAAIAAIVAILFLVTAVVGRWRFPLIGTALLIVASLIVGTVYPAIVQNLTVVPSEQTLEAPYIQRNIKATREAYGVAGVKVVPYNAATMAQPGALRSDAQTTANLRILDPSKVSRTFAQLQQQVQYYQFPSKLDVDRYTINGQITDTVIAVRELNPRGQSSNTWYNNTLVYTHGYGVVAAYGNQRDAKGQPIFVEGNIPYSGKLGRYEPRVYFGESSPRYSIVGSKVRGQAVEIDYPSGAGRDAAAAAKNTYAANGGPKLDSFFNRLVYAIKFQAQEIVLSQDIGAASQILYNRDPIDRVRQVAPYLTPDSNAYPAIVDGRIQWIVDAYTTTPDYPYSQVEQLSSAIADSDTPKPPFALGDSINYIRNSVKATVDAYTGKVTLYAWDAKDPILKTWMKVFPGTVKPKSAMSPALLKHVRYPADLFKMQRSILGAYHVTNTGTFYAGDDKWVTPDDPTVSGPTKAAQPPYYLTMQTPGTAKPAFTLYSTYIPQAAQGQERNVLKGYLTANSDAGPDYGKLTLLTLPKAAAVPGPGQVQNAFNADSSVSQVLNILKRGDSQIVRGNLLTVPVGGGLLNVQPVYVQSAGNTSYPLLQYVLVSFGDQIAFKPTLDEALDALFGGNSGASAGDSGANGTGGATPGTGGGVSGGGTGGGGAAGSNAALRQALQEYQNALQRRQQAYAKNDLVTAAQADADMQAAIARAIAAQAQG